MNIGLYFGSFNPIHVGHLVIANYIVEFTQLDELWFVISPQNPFKEKSSLLDDYQRLRMVELAIEDIPHLRASSIEFSLPQPSYTVNTLAHLEDKYPQHTFSLIMGGDNLQSFKKWKNYQRILDGYTIYVYPRPEYTIPEEFKDLPNIQIVQAPLMEISSSFIRDCIQHNKNVQGFMPVAAWKYLDEMNFYKKTSL
ncbi:MAG: nicotinate-nucleotide adenylyltransferase [Bacteroidales bacterium]|nr:nicotinate-nucleotide adenylyltransferase [Bacteroidales bacterium]